MTRSERLEALDLQWETEDGRNDPEQRFALYRLCECDECGGDGKDHTDANIVRCPECRGEGKVKQLVATCGSPEALGVALVTLAREGEFEECPLGCLDRQPTECAKCGDEFEEHPSDECEAHVVKTTGTWICKPWLPSPRNASDAGKLLRSRRG